MIGMRIGEELKIVTSGTGKSMIGLDIETCNNITRLTLTEYRDYLQSELDQWNANPKDEENPDGYWMHPEDVVGNMKRIIRLNKVLQDFGGELYGTE